MNSEIRDSNGRLIGRITTNGQTREGRDAYGRLKGVYLPKANETKDSTGRRVATGDVLSLLIADLTR